MRWTPLAVASGKLIPLPNNLVVPYVPMGSLLRSVSYHRAQSNEPYSNFRSLHSSKCLEGNSSSQMVRNVIAEATSEMRVRGVTDPESSAWELLAKACGLLNPRALKRVSERLVSSGEISAFRILCKRRLEHEPVQYILGHWDWHNIEQLKVTPPTLIPRPETEELVEMVLESIRQGTTQGMRIKILDVGCGSGAIGLALLRALPEAVCTGIDPSPAAIELASCNAARLDVDNRYTCLLSNINDLSPSCSDDGKGWDLIISNPPYISTDDMSSLPPDVACYEDWAALCGGKDGLEIVHDTIKKAPSLLRLSKLTGRFSASSTFLGQEKHLWMEVDESHPAILEEELSKEANVINFGWSRDLSEMPRFVHMGFRPL